MATHLVKLACELPEDRARSLSTWTCAELARTLIRERVVDTISASSVHRIIASEKLKPWRVHHWLSSKVPRDDRFRETVNNICDLYTRKLGPHERVLSLDEKTSLQPRTLTSRTRPAQPGSRPDVVEHEYVRKGALNLFAAFDTRTGRVLGILDKRKRQVEFIDLLEAIVRTTPSSVTIVHVLRWRPWTALRAPGGGHRWGGPRVPGGPVEVVPSEAGGDKPVRAALRALRSARTCSAALRALAIKPERVRPRCAPLTLPSRPGYTGNSARPTWRVRPRHLPRAELDR